MQKQLLYECHQFFTPPCPLGRALHPGARSLDEKWQNSVLLTYLQINVHDAEFIRFLWQRAEFFTLASLYVRIHGALGKKSPRSSFN